MDPGEICSLNAQQRNARAFAASLVAEHAGTKDRTVTAPLMALSRRIVEIRSGLRQPTAKVGDHGLEVVFEAIADEPIDSAAQQFLGNLALRPVDEKNITLSAGDILAQRYILKDGLGPIFRLRYPENHTDGRNVQYMVPTLLDTARPG